MTEVLTITGVHKRFGVRKVLSDVSLTVAAGEVVALLGDNGSGKSTLLQVVAGILRADGGQITIAGHDLGRQRVAALGALGFAPERADIPEHLLVLEWLDLVASLRRCAAADEALVSRWGLAPLLGLRTGVLSLGQHRRVALASAQLGGPRLLVLDEPTNGLDQTTLGSLREVVAAHAASGGAVVCATHDREFAGQVGSRTCRLRGGVLVEG